MIGVLAKAEQAVAVEEFFQLFKTPWEHYRRGRAYDVVVVSVARVPEVEARLLVLCGADIKSGDAGDGVVRRSRLGGATLTHRGVELPVYRGLSTFEERAPATPCVMADGEAAGLQIRRPKRTVVRLGYDLFDEVSFLLETGQPAENAHVPTLDRHVAILREWILTEGIALLEIPPTPAGHAFAVCLTHDIDFAGIRNHRFDHTMWGFLYRASVGATWNVLRGRLAFSGLIRSWRAVASLPLVYLGWARDFWEPFNWYLRVERGLPATYFVIPFKGRPGDKVTMPHGSRRAAAYDLSDLARWTTKLCQEGCELGVHGIDAWHSAERGRDELARVAAMNGESRIGVRMHWLLRDKATFRTLEDAGFAYDSTVGYNETTGYRSGTAQVFRPSRAATLLELPLHIQDGAMFLSDRLDLSERDAWERCEGLIDHVRKSGGVLTVLWHDRSHGPERFWGDFYVRLVQRLKAVGGWFATGGQVVGWFRKRREVRFEWFEDSDGVIRMRLYYEGGEIRPPLTIRVHRPAALATEIAWNGRDSIELDRLLLQSPAPEAVVG